MLWWYFRFTWNITFSHLYFPSWLCIYVILLRVKKFAIFLIYKCFCLKIFFFIYLFIDWLIDSLINLFIFWEAERQWCKENFYPLAHSPDSCTCPGLQSTPGSRNLMQVPDLGHCHHGVTMDIHWQEARVRTWQQQSHSGALMQDIAILVSYLLDQWSTPDFNL